mmetsp:Transcript_4468/g.8242  ORF Transcript_4468/g.8242 Transcript_4468/m.8242 type:complete len:332 (-) Transcript_4468:115-1110(-)|eukprot:CAMPEP_0178742784 /NCGR_PEP_ID=MMETSP0744-20121128/5861_1 /TAXON_ID=913974 /ORGANISM="Nitzschia punctata, Strain CCMP561" /LENGTH=331 /DNA_ID=CAMNT_0020395753 /DNA_START=144 /DNA_END=1139 /DNA_ORIENTATION=-
MATLKDATEKISELLKDGEPREVDGVSAELHPFPPYVAREKWETLGDLIKDAEQPNLTKIPGEKWISLRCDGTGFGKLTRRLQKEGIFSSGYSNEFAELMKACCQKLMAKCATPIYGYTQSDELTVIMPPASIVRGEQQPHMYNGRLQKLCSLAAATVTCTFVSELMALSIQQKKDEICTAILQQLNPTFDCRVGVYDTQMEALSLILWRAYDCGVNACSDAVHKSGIPGARKIVRYSTYEKVAWLAENNLLPLFPHQREGTLFIKRRRLREGVNQKTGEKVTFMRSKVEPVEGCVLQLYKDGAMFDLGEELDESLDQDNKKARKKARRSK